MRYAILFFTSILFLVIFTTKLYADPVLSENPALKIYYHWGDSQIVNGTPIGISEKDWTLIGNINDLNENRDRFP